MPVQRVRLLKGDCLDVLRTLPDESVDALVTDPPAGISFMGKEWDAFGQRGNVNAAEDKEAARMPKKGLNSFGYSQTQSLTQARKKLPETRTRFIDFLTPRLAECLRVCKPGAVGLVWALPRTSHWTALAVEEAGWVIEEKVYHHFGTGFPKHKSKLKPSTEEWVLCRKPGPLWLGVSECKVGTEGTLRTCNGRREGVSLNCASDGSLSQSGVYGSLSGRWPANLVLSHVAPSENSPGCRLVGTRRVKGSNGVRGASTHIYGSGEGFTKATGEQVGYASADGTEEVEHWICDPECPIRLLDEQAGERKCGGPQSGKVYEDQAGGWPGGRRVVSGYPDKGGPSRFYATFPGEEDSASRFLYCSKASKKDRGEGNNHCTVKSTTLMAWLVKLACPEGGLVLDPFAGSGSTGVASLREGRRFVGVESDPAYYEIARRRCDEARIANPIPTGTPTPAASSAPTPLSSPRDVEG